jgi:amino acid transporter
MAQKKIGLWSATFLGVSAIIGSGWLFAPYRAAMEAGPASILSWVIAVIIIGLLAMCFTEIAALYPQRGLSAIIPTLSHNKYFGFPFAMVNWLGVVAIIALEADAVIQYLISLVPSLSAIFYMNGHLTLQGQGLAILLIIGFWAANYWGASVLVKTNNIFAVLKIVIPVVTAIAIITVSFHPHNFTAIGGTFAPYGYSAVFSAILSCGIIVAFNGFQTVISFANEIDNPTRNIPLSVGLALLFCFIVYVLLQVSFIGGVPPKDILAHGWQQLNYVAPMVQLPLMLGLGFLTTVIYFGAMMAPGGSGVAFTGTATRMFTAMSRYQQMPKFFSLVHPVYGISRRSLLFNVGFAVLFLLLFPSWGQLAEVLGLFHVLSYLPIPLALVIFRNKLQETKHPFFIPFGKPIALFVFVIFTCLFATANFTSVKYLFILLIIFQAIFMAMNIRKVSDFLEIIKQSGWLILFFLGLFLLVWMAPQNAHILSTLWFVISLVIFSVVSFYVLSYSARNDAAVIDASVNIYR